jgi:hypothetical protein
LHAVAELVMAGPQYRTSGTIRLMALGFGTLTAPDLRIDGVDLVAGRDRVAVTGRTCAELAEAVGVLVGPPEDLYHDGSGVGPDEPLSLDADAAGWIHHCWQAGAAVLSQLDPAQQPILWPEHFDVGILSDGVAYGVSPGDEYLSEPYGICQPGSGAVR